MSPASRTNVSIGPDSGEHLQKILNLCQKMNAGRELRDLLLLVAQESARLIRAERVTIFVLDKERRELWSQTTLDGEFIRFDAMLGLAGAAVRSGEVINVPNAQEDDRFYEAVDARTKYKTRSVLVLPLRTPAGEIVGAFQALNKRGGPFDGEDEHIAQTLAAQVAIAIDNTTTVQALRTENAHLWKEVESRFSTQNIIGTSDRIQAIVRLIDQVRNSPVDVLITGESGTGKELVAKALHYSSSRAKHPFVALNIAAIPDTLVDSELFGISEKTATGVGSRLGKFEEAQGGTLFLDEIGELGLPIQTKLLRVLAEREIPKLGSKNVRLDVRVIAATNADLDDAVRKGTFRRDLYYRLKVVTIETPPLREIPEDIPVLAEYLLQKVCRDMERDPKILTPGAKRRLGQYDWPWNVRELENELRRLAVTVRRPSITEGDLSPAIREQGNGPVSTFQGRAHRLKDAVEDLEIRLITNALKQCQGNQLRAAKVLGLSRQGLIKKIKRYRLKVAR